MKPRHKREHREAGLGKYKSQFEKRFSTVFGEENYEPDRLPFTQPEKKRTYIPDFKLRDRVYVELKGRLTVEDRTKMVWVKQQYPDYTFYIFFQNSAVKLYKGSKTSYGEWATKQGFEWSDERRGIPKHWLEATVSKGNPTKR